jgi:hypothetical protein
MEQHKGDKGEKSKGGSQRGESHGSRREENDHG